LLSIDTLPRWARVAVAIAYCIWVVVLAAFCFSVAVRSLDGDDVKLSVEFVTLMGGVLLAPLLPFAQSFSLPGGGEVKIRSTETAQRATKQAEIASAGLASAEVNLPEVDLLNDEASK